MFFKNITAYRLPDHSAWLQADLLEEALAARPFAPCTATQPAAFGWVPVLGGETTALSYCSGNRFLIRMKREEKLLPPGVVRDLVAAKVSVIEKEQGRKVYRKERLTIQDEIILDSLPRAFSQFESMLAYIDAGSGWIFVDTASTSKAESLLNGLRECIGSLPVILPQVTHSPSVSMTAWLTTGEAPEGFGFGDSCVLEWADGAVRCRGVDLCSDEVGAHISAGMQVSRLAMVRDGLCSFTLGDDLRLRSVRFSDELLRTNDDAEDVLDRAAADFELMSSSVTELYQSVIDLFGGIEQ